MFHHIELINYIWTYNGQSIEFKVKPDGVFIYYSATGIQICNLNTCPYKATVRLVSGTKTCYYLNNKVITCNSDEEFLKLLKLKAFL